MGRRHALYLSLAALAAGLLCACLTSPTSPKAAKKVEADTGYPDLKPPRLP